MKDKKSIVCSAIEEWTQAWNLIKSTINDETSYRESFTESQAFYDTQSEVKEESTHQVVRHAVKGSIFSINTVSLSDTRQKGLQDVSTFCGDQTYPQYRFMI